METYWNNKLTSEEIKMCAHLLNDIMHTQGSPISHYGDVDTVCTSLKTLRAIQKVRVLRSSEDNHMLGILVWGVCQFWWSKESFIYEDLVLVVDPEYKGFAREAIKLLEELAETNECKGILSGCILQDKPQMVLNSYRKFGFTEVIPNMFKEVNTF